MRNEARSQYIDWVKGLGIVLVVLGHCIQYGSGEEYLNHQEYYSNIVFRVIYSFHMPLFMTLSGYLFEQSCKKKSYFSIFVSRIKTLGIPIIAWGTIDFLLGFIGGYKTLGIVPLMKRYLWSIIQAPWFLWAVLMCSLVLLGIRWLLKDNLLIYLLVVLLFFVTPDSYNFVWFKFMYPFFLVGYMWNKYQWSQKINILKENKLIRVGGVSSIFFIYIILFMLFDEKCYIYATYVSCLYVEDVLQQIAINFIRWGIGIVGAALVLYITYICFNRMKGKLYFIWLGQHSMGIYVLNIYFNLYILKVLTFNLNYNLLYAFLETLFGLTLCSMLTVIFKRNKLTNKILLGGR